MRKKLQLTLAAFFAFTSGTIAHAKYQYIPTTHIESPKKSVRRGKASWYSKRDRGIKKRTANNEIFDDQDMTCAMWGVAFNQRLKVTNLENGKSIVVRVNDRGPHKRYVRKGRVLDLTKRAFSKIASIKKGLINIEIEFL